MEWIAVVELIISLLAKCRENRRRRSIQKSVRRGGRFERLIVGIAVRRSGGTAEDVKLAHSLIDACKNCTEEDASAILDQVEDKARLLGVTMLGDGRGTALDQT